MTARELKRTLDEMVTNASGVFYFSFFLFLFSVSRPAFDSLQRPPSQVTCPFPFPTSSVIKTYIVKHHLSDLREQP